MIVPILQMRKPRLRQVLRSQAGIQSQMCLTWSPCLLPWARNSDNDAHKRRGSWDDTVPRGPLSLKLQ